MVLAPDFQIKFFRLIKKVLTEACDLHPMERGQEIEACQDTIDHGDVQRFSFYTLDIRLDLHLFRRFEKELKPTKKVVY